jgi:trehalose 6-phosphate phosphatase
VNTSAIPVEVIEPLLRVPRQCGVFADFDGTLSEIVNEPGDARPIAGAVEALHELAGVVGRVGVLSGRPVAFLEDFFPDEVLLAGLYGLETRFGAVRTDHPLSGAWREVIDDVASVAEARGPAGMKVEPKGLSLTLHYRGLPRLEPEVRAFAEQQSARSGLQVRSARMSYELHPPIPADKGTAIVELSDDLRAVCFVGDDVGDLSAFDALDALAAEGTYSVRVAVRSAEVDARLLERADIVVEGPSGALEFLRSLARHLRGA